MKRTNFSLELSRADRAYGWMYFALQLFVLPTVLYAVANILGIVSEAVINFLYYLLNCGCCVAIFRRLLVQSYHNAGRDIWNFLLAVSVGYGAYCLCAFAVTAALAVLAPEFSNVNDANLITMIGRYPLLMGLGTVVLTPVAEECLYRGLLFVPLRQKSRAAAYAVSTVGFALAHVLGYIGTYPAGTLALCVAQYIPAGLCLAWACERSGSLWAPVLIHAAVNLTSILSLR